MNQQATNKARLSDLCFVYAKAKWMQSFKAFDLEGCFPGNLLYASMLEDNEDNREKLQKLANQNQGQGIQFQLRKDNRVIFQTTLSDHTV